MTDRAKRVDSLAKESDYQIYKVQNIYLLGGFKEFENCRFLDFDRPVYRFLPVFSLKRLNHRVPEVKAVQNIYTLGGFKQFENCRFLDFDRPVYRFLPVFEPNGLDQRVPQNIYGNYPPGTGG